MFHAVGLCKNTASFRCLTRTNCLPNLKAFGKTIPNCRTGCGSSCDEGLDPGDNPQNLPRQPVPKLEQTLATYLTSVKPLLSKEELECTKKSVKDFECNEGPKLQKLLEKKAQCMTNWMSKWWLNAAYLEQRSTVVVNSSPGLVFPEHPFHNKEEMVKYTAKLIRGAMEFKDMVEKKKLKIDKAGKADLDMGQYPLLFGTCRNPGIKIDCISYHPRSKFILLMHKNHFFKVPVYGGPCKDKLLNEDQLAAQIRGCLQAKGCKEKGDPIGILTSENRTTWGKAFEELTKNMDNKNSFKVVEAAQFVVAIDGPLPKSNDLCRRTACAKLCLHGGGSKYNSANRWFDKTLQFVIGHDGLNGITYEHAPADGVPVVAMTDFVVKYM